MTAPVALFVYNRPDHTRRTLSALQANPEAGQTDLYIFSDGAKSPEHQKDVLDVRKVCKSFYGFRSVRMVERESNYGLARSIIEGVSEVVERYGQVIVLEDDLVTSPAFLGFMNKALNYYRANPEVWHISGWSYPIDVDRTDDAFFWRGMNCWGWGTWQDRWRYFQKDPEGVITRLGWKQKRAFDLEGTKVFWPQIKQNARGDINTWAIFWYATIFLNGGLCLNPWQSYVTNIGHDGTGVHCGNTEVDQSRSLNMNRLPRLPDEFVEDTSAVTAIKDYYRSQRQPFGVRVVNKLGRSILGRNLLS